jgi:hypothetical protein
MGYFAQQSLDVLDGDLTVMEQVTEQLERDFPQDGIGSLRTLAVAFQFSTRWGSGYGRFRRGDVKAGDGSDVFTIRQLFWCWTSRRITWIWQRRRCCWRRYRSLKGP